MKGYVVQMEETIVSVVPDSQFDWDFVDKYRDKILTEKDKLPDEKDVDFRMRMNAVAEKIRRQREMSK